MSILLLACHAIPFLMLKSFSELKICEPKIFVVIYTFEDVIGKSFNLDVVPNVDWHAFGFGFI